MDRRVNQVRALYVALLGRQPEPAALAVQAQRDPETVVRNILNSQEFKRRNRQTGIPAQTALRERPALGELDEDRVVFLHIPKCGGTTLHHMLGEWYGTDKVHPERHNRLYQWSAANLTSSRVFSGHYDFYSTRLIPGNVRRISFLRDPIARLLSLYHFHR
ncbi:MAG: sulfotransferase family 2 domain-containing protein, partial [Pseudomonadota bacterium]